MKQIKLIGKFNLERITLILIGLSFFIGIWHALPMLNVVNDEMYYVGGTLRAIENHTIIPALDDVPYGTLTYVLNYGMTLVTLSILFVFFKFDFTSLKLYLIESPWIMYLSLRFLSALLSIVLLYYVNKIVKKEIEDVKTRLFLILILFTNIITTVILHTGKVWVASVLFVIISFYYLHDAVLRQGVSLLENNRKSVFMSVLFSFIALANFPLNFFSLVNIPILFFFYRNDKSMLYSLTKYMIVGLALIALVTTFNFYSIKNQIILIFANYHPITEGITYKLGFGKSLFSYLYKLLVLFPILIFTFLHACRNRIRNKSLFLVSLVYFLIYFVTIVFVANWTGDPKAYLRYLFPLGFFMIFLISSLNITFNKIFYLVGTLSVVIFMWCLYLLSVPTTYNEAYLWVNNNLGNSDVLIINNVSELQLTKNKKSSLLVKEASCATKCQNIIRHDLNSNYNFTVIDNNSKSMDIDKKKKNIYYIEEIPKNTESLQLVQSFANKSTVYHSVDYNLGNYFDLSLYSLKNLGKNIYIYKLK